MASPTHQDSHAHMELAVMYAKGEGMPVDMVEARVRYARAIRSGDLELPQFLQFIESSLSAKQAKQAQERIKMEELK